MDLKVIEDVSSFSLFTESEFPLMPNLVPQIDEIVSNETTVQ